MTGIEWTDETWNPVVGCSRVSDGCRHCYAETMDRRIRAIAGEEWRPWTAPNAAYNVRLHPERLTTPLRWRKPRRVFVNSMSDLFHEQVPDEFIDRVFAVMALSPQHTYQVLTKRPRRMLEYLGAADRYMRVDETAAEVSGAPGAGIVTRWPLPNVWLGVSVEDQRAATERIPLLLETPAAVRFLSCEPLLEPLNIRGHLASALLHWVIVGGESGPGARQCGIEWIRDIVAQCKTAGVACFVKQLGSSPVSLHRAICGVAAGADESGERWAYRLRDRKGGDPAEWPDELRVREFPTVLQRREFANGK